MRIGELATACDCSAETIRYYERVGLLEQPPRSANRYRVYDDRHLKGLKFILRARSLGFTQDEVRQLVDIAHMQTPACEAVHTLLSEQISQVRRKLRELRQLEKSLTRLRDQCEDGSLNECPVIDELMGG